MTEYVKIHPQDPQPRLITQAVTHMARGGVFVYPTDSGYALGCLPEDKNAITRIRTLRQLDKAHNFTLMCRDLSEIARYAHINNATYRLLKANTPGAYTFLLNATKAVPRRLQHPKRKTIGLRVPTHPVILACLAELDLPLLSVSLMLPEEDLPPADIDEVKGILRHQVELIVDGGFTMVDSTTIVDLTGSVPKIIREGKGDCEPFLY